ncbi:MAG TPA: Calx-beta domain-containing protein, partial [Blastocatellia bacterium]|nr:Calx-beta domain-containing protein [Blastocatellia bacterium]
MKRLMVISVLVFVLAPINFTILMEPSFSASAAMPAQGQPFFSVNNVEVTEGPGAQAVFTISLTYQGGFRDFSSSVSYTTMNGTAASPADYQQASGTVSFPPGPNPGGTASMTVSIPIVDDNETEGDETFTVVLSNPSPAFVLSPATGTCTIHDDDSGPSSIVILDAEVSEGDAGTTDAVFRVGLNGSASSGVSVDFATENLSAVAGSDYSSRAGTLTIPAGQRSADIVVPIVGDTLPELTQGFIVRLSNAQGAQIQDGEAVGVIIDNDDPETITVCSSDTPKQSQAVDFSSRIDSVVNIDRDLIVD